MKTTLLTTPYGASVLDRDQVWFTEKARDGRPRCFRFRVWPRKRENLERGYRHGRYGAVPDISPGELVRLMRLGQSDSEAAQSPGLGPTGSALD